MAQILVTGVTGFIGRNLLPVLSAHGHKVVEAGRRPSSDKARFFAVGDIGPETEWHKALAGVDAVVHLAGLAHSDGASEADLFSINDAGTGRLIEACEAEGVQAVVLVSSIAAREAAAVPERASAYGRSKLAGEAHVRRFAEVGRTGIVLRPPLVYGYDAPGKWQKIQRLAASRLPLPFGAVANRRSLLSVGNINEAILVAVTGGLEGRGAGTYEIADRETVSLADIVGFLREGMGKPRRLVPLSRHLLRLAGEITGRRAEISALLDDLTVDPSAFMRVFGWNPPESARCAIMRSGRLFLSAR